MVSLSFSSFMLVVLLFINFLIKGSIAHSDDQGKRTLVVHEAENGYTMALNVEKEVMDGVPVPAAAEFNNYGRMGGRKMMVEKKNKKEVEVTEEADSKNSSGNSNNPSNKPLGDSRKNIHHDQKLESEKLMDDATEFFTMMNKDYVGGPGSGSKPRHKPPINNFQPFHGSNP